MEVKVSIIVSCYNQGCYLAESLDSILQQTFSNWECLIINDGSTDNTEVVANSYIQKDNRIIYIYQDNQGVCAARNNAIKKSSGEYVLCLDADDKISPEYVELCVKELELDSKIAVVACNYMCFGKKHGKVILEPYSLEKLMGHNLFVNCSMFRRIDFERVKGFNENMKLGLEDWDFWLSILAQGAKVKYLKGFHFFYRMKSARESRNQTTFVVETQKKLRKQIWENHKDLYSEIYSSPYYSVEYLLEANSIEYRLGKLFLRPFRIFRSLFD